MKNFWLLFSFLFFLCNIIANGQTPTDAGIPDANHVLVVYNSLDQTSVDVKDYYQNARDIPESNIVPLESLVRKDITINSVTHPVIIAQEGDIIRDSVNHELGNGTKTFHAWRYYLNYVWAPIKEHIENNNLSTTIRYIVLCKGVPFKIQANADGSNDPGNVTVDGLLCMLNTADYESFITNTIYPDNFQTNPYYNVDPNFTMDYRFRTDHFNGSGYKLSYLVSHLDGVSYDVVKRIIDRSIDPDMSGTAFWILDDDPGWSIGEFTVTRDKLDELGFNVFLNVDDTWITSYPENVMGYTSWGTHAEDGNCDWEDSAWVKDSLHFDLANGSVFNTYESFNGNSLTTLNWRYVARPNPLCHHTQGLATQFTEIGGTGTMGHAWEPGTPASVVRNSIFFPAYQMGYNLIDAYYQGLPSLAWQYVLVGDPLVRIYGCENTVISSNTTIGSGDYQCNIIVPQNVVLTIASGSTINLSRNAALKVYGTLVVSENDTLNFDGYSKLIIDSLGTLSIGSGSHFNFYDHSKFIMKHVFEITTDYDFVFNDESEFQANGLNMGINSNITFNNASKISVNGLLNLSPGTTLNFYDESNSNVNGSFTSIGESSNKVMIKYENSFGYNLYVKNGLNFVVDNTIVNNRGLTYFAASTQNNIENLSITNTTFNNVLGSPALSLQTSGSDVNTMPIISNCTFNNCMNLAMYLNQVLEISIEHNTISLGVNANGIYLSNNGLVNISDCAISGGIKGIYTPTVNTEEIEIIEDLFTDLSITQCTFESEKGIELNGLANPFSSVNINANYFENCVNGIIINAFSHPDPYYDFIPVISNNVISGYRYGGSEIGISLSNGDEVFVRNNSITNFLTGISLNTVTNPSILENTISASDLRIDPQSGILAVSSDGQIRNNTIQNHWFGIELGSSSPNIGANTITDNLRYGIYINANSHPDLSEQIVGGDPYPLSGYNTIRENGECNFSPSYSEIYLRFSSTVNLEKGCNTIADDREDPALHCNYLYLIDGHHVVGKVNAFRNYWGEVNGGNPEGRFGPLLRVNYGGWLTGPCTYTEVGSALFLVNSKGEVYDTVYTSGEAPSELTDIESRYAAANEYYYSNNFSQAKQEYQGIIEDYGDSTESLQAYNRLYSIANLLSSSPETFNQLKEFYLQKAGNQTDSIMVGTLTHLSDLCLVSATEYLVAITNFDEIAQQNPNTDIALYRQIDALTTALLLPQDSTLNKGILGKYSVNGLSDYTNKLSELLKTRGKNGLESAKELLPTEYTLYQNYPNPFNPSTTIKYDLPFASEVSLIIYDILGRKVKELVNTKQEAGRYEVQFNASNLASGVYIYQLIAEKYMSSKKMILLK